MKKTKSLKKEILQLLISFCIIAIVTLGIFSIINQYQNKLNIIEHNQKQVLLQVENELNKFLNRISYISDYISDNYKENKFIIKNVVDINKNISSILVLDKNGIIENFYAPFNLNIYKGFDYSNKKYFKVLKEKKYSQYWSSVFLSTINEKPSLSYSFKYRNKVIVLLISLNEISEFITRFKNQDGSHMVRVFDKNGVLFINPDAKDLVFQRQNAKSSEVFRKLIDNRPTYTQVIFKSFASNKNQYGIHSKLNQTQWKIVVRQSYDKILESLKQMVLGIIFAIIFFILLAIYLSLKISKKIFNAFSSLEYTINRISIGIYDGKIKETPYDEFNYLLENFNKMQNEIDKRKEKIEESLHSFRTLFNSTMETIIIHKDGICIDANDVAVSFLGFENKRDLIGKNISSFIVSNKQIFSKNKKSIVEEFQLSTVDNKFFTCLGRKEKIKINKDNLEIFTLINISELKQKDKLLFQQSKMASMGEMIGNIAHQWRQPLSMISTCASAIKFEKEFGKLEDNKLFETMDLIVNNAKYLSKTIDDFRNFLKQDKNKETFSLKNSVETVLELLKATLKNNEIKVEAILNKNIKILGYPSEFVQVLINILNNSKDAFILNKIENRIIKINLYFEDDWTVLDISDNAGGINEKIIENIFDPYFTTKHKSKGTGIGLYMSHQIINEHMRGELLAHNIMDKNTINKEGACFRIKLPLE